MLKFTRLPFWNTHRDCTVHSARWIESLSFIQNTHFCKETAYSSLEKGFYWHRYMNIPSASTLEKGFGLFINLSADLPAKSNSFFSETPTFEWGGIWDEAYRIKFLLRKCFLCWSLELKTCKHVSMCPILSITDFSRHIHISKKF